MKAGTPPEGIRVELIRALAREAAREDHRRSAAIFEEPRKPAGPELTEAQRALAKKREERARVIERLRSPRLSQGIARELRGHAATLEREIADLASGQ